MSRRDERRPRRRTRSPASRLRPYWVILTLVLVVVAAAALGGASWKGFEPKQIDVFGNRVVSRDDIVRSAQIRLDESMWLQDTRAMTARIDELPYVESASVHRVPPSHVVIVVTERVPLAVAENGSQSAIVDRHLRVLAPADGSEKLAHLIVPASIVLEPGRTLPVPAPQLAGDLDTLGTAHIDVAQLSLDRYGQLQARLRDGTRVLFGDDDDLAVKARLLPAIQLKLARSPQPVAAIDLRALATPIVVYK